MSKLYAKHIIKPYRDVVWADNETAQLFKKLDTEAARRYSGRRIFRTINRWKIKEIISNASYTGKRRHRE